jgi:transposase
LQTRKPTIVEATRPGRKKPAQKLSARSELAAAFRYMLARWPLDNNPAERALRGVAIGRKNCLFAGRRKAVSQEV